MKNFIIILLIFLVGCNNSKELSLSEKEEYLTLGDSISNKAQMILLSNVGKQIQQNGTVGAVDFCNEKAIFLTDSLSDKNIKIQRLSDKNRNSINVLQSKRTKKRGMNYNKIQKVNIWFYRKTIRFIITNPFQSECRLVCNVTEIKSPIFRLKH